MDKADPHPVRDQYAGAAADFLEPARIYCPINDGNDGIDGDGAMESPTARGRRFGKVLGNHVIGESLEQFQLAVSGKYLEVPETHERRGHPAYDCARLGLRIAVIKHVTHHRLPRCDETQRPCRRHTQVMHGFAAEKFPDRRAQHRAAVCGTRNTVFCPRP